MIGTIIKISLLRLWNKKSELWLLIAVPILFFSIFALIFSRGVAQTEKQITVSIVNDDSAPLTGALCVISSRDPSSNASQGSVRQRKIGLSKDCRE